MLTVMPMVGCATTRHVVTLGEQEPAVIVDVTVIDGTGSPPLTHQDVVIDGGRIVAIGPTAMVIPRGRVIDGRGQTVLPGYVDAHVHIVARGAIKDTPGLSAEENLERWLRVGVTTAFDLSGAASAVARFDDRIAAGTIASPRLFHTNLVITGTDSYPIGIADELMPVPGWLVRLAVPQVGDEGDIDGVLDDVEQTLRTEFMATLSRTQRRDPHENMAEILNNLDRANLNRLMTTIEELAPEGAEKVKSLMFTFEDLMKLTPQDIQAVLREVDKDALGIALKGATEDQRRMFFQAMSERAVKLLQEEIASMGPVRIRDVYDAQGRIVNTTKDLINRGVIEIADDDEGSEMIE
jgi:hypothetical protein